MKRSRKEFREGDSEKKIKDEKNKKHEKLEEFD